MNLDNTKRFLVSSVIEFLHSELKQSNLSEEKKESVEVAIQCLEQAYEMTREEREKIGKADLLTLLMGSETKQKSEVTESARSHGGPATPEEVTDKMKNQAEVHKKNGNEAMKRGEYQLAVDEYTKAIHNNPFNAIYFCNRAAAYSRLDKHFDAILDCKEAIKLDPSYGKAYGRLGIAYSNVNMLAEAKNAYAMAIKLDPTNEMYETNLKLLEKRAEEAGGELPIGANSGDAFQTLCETIMSQPQFPQLVRGFLDHPPENIENLLRMGHDIASTFETRNQELPDNVQSILQSFLRRSDPNSSTSSKLPPQPPNQNNDSN